MSAKSTSDFKVALLGSSDSGKTSLIKFLKGVNFEEDNATT